MVIRHICIRWKDGNEESHDLREQFETHYSTKHGLFRGGSYAKGNLVTIDVNDARIRYTIQSNEHGLIYEVVPLSSIDAFAYTED